MLLDLRKEYNLAEQFGEKHDTKHNRQDTGHGFKPRVPRLNMSRGPDERHTDQHAHGNHPPDRSDAKDNDVHDAKNRGRHRGHHGGAQRRASRHAVHHAHCKRFAGSSKQLMLMMHATFR